MFYVFMLFVNLFVSNSKTHYKTHAHTNTTRTIFWHFCWQRVQMAYKQFIHRRLI